MVTAPPAVNTDAVKFCHVLYTYVAIQKPFTVYTLTSPACSFTTRGATPLVLWCCDPQHTGVPEARGVWPAPAHTTPLSIAFATARVLLSVADSASGLSSSRSTTA